jgi:hypothetical protein
MGWIYGGLKHGVSYERQVEHEERKDTFDACDVTE